MRRDGKARDLALVLRSERPGREGSRPWVRWLTDADAAAAPKYPGMRSPLRAISSRRLASCPPLLWCHWLPRRLTHKNRLMVNRWFPWGWGLQKIAQPDMKTTVTAALMFRLRLLIFSAADAR